jgi:ribonuclease D
VPQNIIDTQIAAGFIGFGYPIGYGKLLQALLGVSLSKTESHTDWLARPLSEEQIAYALDDVRHLLPIYDQLEIQLNQAKRTGWVEEECKRYCSMQYYEEDRERKYLRIKGASTLSRRGLACLQKMYAWRDALAHKSNRPARTILSDSIILELSRRPPKNAQEMQRVRSVRPDQIAKYGAEIMNVVDQARALSDGELPYWPASMGPGKKEVLQADMLYAILKVLCYDSNLAPELVATRDEVQALVKAHREGAIDSSHLPIVHGWRCQLAGQSLISILDGSSVAVRLSGGSSPVKLAFSKGESA